VNVDGSYVAETGAAEVGVVARDSMGMIIFTVWRAIQRCASEAEVEAQACVEGLKMAVRLAPGQVILETDCCRLVKALQGKEDRSEIGFFVAEVKELG
jgi:ribonuclease HI